MTRQLRPRKSRPDYLTLSGANPGNDDGNSPEPGPAASAALMEDVDSGSDFEPSKVAVNSAEDDAAFEGDEDAHFDGMDEDKHVELVHDPAAVLALPPPSVSASPANKGKAKAGSKSGKSSTGPTLARPSRRQQYSLPTPSVHHRHRAVPLFIETSRVERLATRPKLFEPTPLVWTNSFTHNPRVTDRIQKAWGYNVGDGPIWELVEDRGWYKESAGALGEEGSEARRRPRVYQDIKVKDGWVVLTKDEAKPYLPTDTTTTEEGEFKPAPPLHCYFGPFDRQEKHIMQMFDTLEMSTLFDGSESVVFNAGAPVWGIDWCPIHVDDRESRAYKKYLAVAPFPSSSHSPEIGVRVARPSTSCIQIWSFVVVPQEEAGTDVRHGGVKCEMVICHDGGPAYELKWCPLPSHDLGTDLVRPRKLGLLGGTFEDGSFSVHVIPDPADVKPQNHDTVQPVYVKLPDPLLRIELEETLCWAFDWANSEVVAIGTTNGIIAVYNLGSALKKVSNSDTADATSTDLLPTHYLSVHQSAIRALCWIRAPPCQPSGLVRTDDNPTVIASGGYDGVECMTDIREGRASVMNRTRDVINAMTFSSFGGGPITIDHENIVKAYSASPSMLGRGHTLMDPQGPVWSICASEYHPQLAVGSADGTCATTNTLRTTRRGGSVPFFVHKIYKMDYSRKTDEYRMLEHFLPQEMQERASTSQSSGKKANKAKAAPAGGTGAWPQQVGVQRVAWNSGNGPASSALLASATASGLCRIDVLWGRWIKSKVPYGSVENIRGEDGAAMDMDSDSSD
ncbi:hypothetical protein AX17_005418 [Amanita inopinata Kibby_2008]|nr:hypothetical protein AX17_005418 [Amanita inopinata Kibby_2008]